MSPAGGPRGPDNHLLGALSGSPSPSGADPPEEDLRLSPLEEEILQQAREAYAAGDHAGALALYHALVRDYPQRAVFWNDRGVTLDALGRHTEAEHDYRRAAKLFPEYELAYRNLSNCLVFQQREAEALESLLKSIKLKPSYEGAYRDALAILLSRGPGREDLAYARALARRFRTAFAHFVFGIVEGESGRWRAAMRQLKRATALLRDDAALKRELAAEYPRVLGEFEKSYGNALFAAGAIPEAVDAYRRAIDANFRDEESWNNLGFAYFSVDESELAVDCFRRAVEINPKYKHAWYNLAYTYQSNDLLEESIEAYKRTLECDPLDEVAWNNRGNAEYNLGRFEPSIPYFEKAVEINPDYDIAWNNIGNALNKVGRHAEAIPFHERSLRANPRFDYAWYALSKSRFHTGDIAGAVRDIEECLAVNPEFDSGWALKAEILLHLGDLEEALEAAEQAVTFNPDNDHAHFVRGEILERLGRLEAAEAAFERAIAIAGDVAQIRGRVPDVWASHGEMLLARDRLREAVTSFSKAAELNPMSLIAREGLGEARARLEQYRDALVTIYGERGPSDPGGMLGVIRVYLETGEYKAAAAAADRYRKRFGDDPEVRLLEGEAFYLDGKHAEARDVLGRAARGFERKMAKEREQIAQAVEQGRKRGRRAKNNRKQANLNSTRNRKAGAREDEDEWEEIPDGRLQIAALKEEGMFLEPLVEEPEGGHFLRERLYRALVIAGGAALAQRKVDDARALLLRASRVEPERAEAWYRLGMLTLGSGDTKAAESFFETAVGAEPESELGWIGLARVARKNGKVARAARFEGVGARLAPGHPAFTAKSEAAMRPPGAAG